MKTCSNCGDAVEQFAQGGGPNERLCPACARKLVKGEISRESE